MRESYRIYSAMCRLLAVAFAVVGVGLFAVPGVLASTIEFLGRFVGLTGEVTLGTGDLDHVLAVSLMACIVVLAVGTARRPEQLTPYVALLAAKVVSTAGFAYLAILGGSVWTLAALADGSVIVVLVVARSLASPSQSSEEP